ncbi:MAG: YicC family protein [Lentisphaeria bacterium]|nr:YicC family protein [Lentisphaeria bacterium]
MKSMTGFGKGSFEKDGVVSTVEISTVNRKQLDIRFNQVSEIRAFEIDYRKVIALHLARGTVNVKVVLTAVGGSQVSINRELLKKYTTDLTEVAKALGVNGELKIADLMTLPQVIREESGGIDPVLANEVTTAALNLALESLVKMRSFEGEEMRRDLELRVDSLMTMVEKINVQSPLVVEAFHTRLKERVAVLLKDTIELDEVALAREVAFFAERSDISEELTRLDSHFVQMKTLLGQQEQPVGRNLDFLIQEIYREINTTGTKASDSEISKQVVAFKTELEKIREQVQNVE